MKVHFMFGLPLSGKTTYIKNNFSLDIFVVSADTIKEAYDDYDPLNSHLVHQRSVEDAEKLFYEKIELGEEVVFDGGGINTNYNIRLINRAKSLGYEINLIVIDTPAEICLQRNLLRERKIPEQVIIDKAIRYKKCLANLKSLVDNINYCNYFTNKHFFVDMDGTIAAYQQLPVDEFGCIDFISGEYFKYATPVQPIIDKLLTYTDSELHILSAIPDNLCMKDKDEWLDIHFNVDSSNRYFIGNRIYKAVMLRNILKKKKIKPQDVTMIEDDHRNLLDLKKIGINAVHTSQFLAEF